MLGGRRDGIPVYSERVDSTKDSISTNLKTRTRIWQTWLLKQVLAGGLGLKQEYSATIFMATKQNVIILDYWWILFYALQSLAVELYVV